MKKFITSILCFVIIFTAAAQIQIAAANTSASQEKSASYKPWSLCKNFTSFNLNSIASDMKGTDVSIGQRGTIMVSKKNSAWQIVHSGTYETLNNVLWDGKKFLAFGCNGTLVYSYDGLKWNKQSISTQGDLCNPFIANNCYFVQYNIAASKTPYIYDSTEGIESVEMGILISHDGLKWSKIKLPALLDKASELKKIIYFKGHYIAVINQSDYGPSKSYVLTSANLSSWKEVKIDERLQDIACNGKNAVAVGDNFIMRSSDAANWEKTNIEKKKPLNANVIHNTKFAIKSIISVGNKFTLCGIYYSSYNTNVPCKLLVANSTDAKKWVFNCDNNFDVDYARCYNLTFSNHQYNIIISNCEDPRYLTKLVMKSNDGIHWQKTNWNIEDQSDVNCIIWDGQQYIGCGNYGLIAKSKNGTNWIKIIAGMYHSLYLSDPEIIYDGSEFVYDYPSTYYTSKDGLTWTNSADLSTSISKMNSVEDSNLINKIYATNAPGTTIWDGQKFISAISTLSNISTGGESSNITYSNNFIDYVKASIELPNGDKSSSLDCYALAFTGSQYFAIVGNNLICKSNDGINWKAQESKNIQDVSVSDITYGNNMYVLTTLGNGIFNSRDGVTWKNVFKPSQFPQSSTYILRIIYHKNVFIALYGNLILTSTDGEKWSKSYSNNLGQISFIKWLDNEFIAGGENGTILTSTDGYNWKRETSPIPEDFYSAASGAGKTIIISTYNNIIYR